MPQVAKKKNIGLLIFLGLILVFLCASLFAYIITGPQGIEERFLGALGGEQGEPEEEGGGILGFFIEGNILLYSIILGILIMACILAFMLLKP